MASIYSLVAIHYITALESFTKNNYGAQFIGISSVNSLAAILKILH